MSATGRGGRRAEPVFVGLSHIGQVFSIGWARKFGRAAVFDFDPGRTAGFRRGVVTEEEPDLGPALTECRDRIEVHADPARIRDYPLVFLTMDTPLEADGTPRVDEVFAFVRRCADYVGEHATLVVPSQVYPGFCARVRAEVLGDRPDVKLVYMVDTLKMGSALPRFLEPEQLVFGAARAEDVPDEFAEFACERRVLSYHEAEMVKIAINVYLAFGVTFANAMDNYCRQFGVRFAPVAESLRCDARIGRHAYIAPSLGISGGHLERDLTTVLAGCADAATRRLFAEIVGLNAARMDVLYAAFEAARRADPVRSVLWVGASYKATSFSLVNSPFSKFVQRYASEVRVRVYDGCHPLPAVGGAVTVDDLKGELERVDLAIFNYGTEADAAAVRRASADHGRRVLDISLPPSLGGEAGTSPRVRRPF